MIIFNYENNFLLENEILFQEWISNILDSENKTEGEINYVFCNDDYLLNLNKKHLNHDTLTDVISFDYTLGSLISGDIFISTERVLENAIIFNVTFQEELLRVMAHGILHYCGYNDKSEHDVLLMRSKEDEKTNLFHVKQG